MGVTGRPIAGVVPAFAAFDADELSRARQQCEAHLRQLLEVGAEALLLRLDVPTVILPQMHIQLAATSNGDLMLLETLAPAVRCLTGNVLSKGLLFLRKKCPIHPAFGHTPQLTVTAFHIQHHGLDFRVYAVRFVIPVHQTTVFFFRHLVFQQCFVNT